MIELKVLTSLGELEKVLTDTVGARTYWLHTMFGGPGWMVSNAHQAVKTVTIIDDRLATFVRLKIK